MAWVRVGGKVPVTCQLSMDGEKRVSVGCKICPYLNIYSIYPQLKGNFKIKVFNKFIDPLLWRQFG